LPPFSPHPEPPLVEGIAHVHAAGGGDAGEGEHHHADQSAVAQPHHAIVTSAVMLGIGLPFSQIADIVSGWLHARPRS
jgi:hypothetical protein